MTLTTYVFISATIMMVSLIFARVYSYIQDLNSVKKRAAINLAIFGSIIWPFTICFAIFSLLIFSIKIILESIDELISNETR